jgi:hypothetical protein
LANFCTKLANFCATPFFAWLKSKQSRPHNQSRSLQKFARAFSAFRKFSFGIDSQRIFRQFRVYFP